jgi:hypothetical protein
MFDTTMLPNVILSTAALLGLWVLFHWPYASYRRDLLQNRLFGLRQDLFDFARKGSITFNHPAYGVLRTTINGFIRVGPRLNFIGVVILLATIKLDDIDHRESYTARLDRLSADLPKDVAEELRKFRFRLNFLVFCHIVLTSLPISLFLWPISAALRCVDGFRWAKPRLLSKLRLDRVDNAAFVIGSGDSGIDPGYSLPGLRAKRA